MQAASDVFLGWTRGATNHYYWRQLRDMKGSAAVETYTPRIMASYARLCGWTLARAHARSGDPVAIASYLGTGAVFDRAITEFAARYADQNEEDYEQLLAAIESGRVEADLEA
jgi:predicted alpha/beta hydrolase